MLKKLKDVIGNKLLFLVTITTISIVLGTILFLDMLHFLQNISHSLYNVTTSILFVVEIVLVLLTIVWYLYLLLKIVFKKTTFSSCLLFVCVCLLVFSAYIIIGDLICKDGYFYGLAAFFAWWFIMLPSLIISIGTLIYKYKKKKQK